MAFPACKRHDHSCGVYLRDSLSFVLADVPIALPVKGYAKHERDLFEKVTKARTNAIKAEGPAQQAKAENMLTDALKSVFAVAENYPDLRATENYQKLQDELSDTENKIMAARRFYNANVRDLNTKIETFPTNVINSAILHFQKREFFEADEAAEKEPVKVDL